MDDNTDVCPRCAAHKIVDGDIYGEDRATKFWPNGLRHLQFTGRLVPLRGKFGSSVHACTACGLLWSEVDAGELLHLMRNTGTAATRREFSSEHADE
jgi:Zn-finger nucleic acid-binding protein